MSEPEGGQAVGDLLWSWSDGSATVLVERLALGEVGICTLGGGVILSDEGLTGLAAVLTAAESKVGENPVTVIREAIDDWRMHYDPVDDHGPGLHEFIYLRLREADLLRPSALSWPTEQSDEQVRPDQERRA